MNCMTGFTDLRSLTRKEIVARLKVLVPTEDFPPENRAEVEALRRELVRNMRADGEVVIVGSEVLEPGPPEEDLS
jgi:hypothetical protein